MMISINPTPNNIESAIEPAGMAPIHPTGDVTSSSFAVTRQQHRLAPPDSTRLKLDPTPIVYVKPTTINKYVLSRTP